MKNIIAALLFVTLSAGATLAHAAPGTPPPKTVATLVSNYLGAAGCLDGAIDGKLFAPFVDPANQINGFVALAHADIGCWLGSGTVNPTLVFLKTADGQQGQDKALPFLRVDPTLSEPTARTQHAPKVVTSLFQRGGQLYATGLTYGKEEPNCCPSVKATYQVVLRKNQITLAKDDVRSVYTWDFLPAKLALAP
jgi:hypothetical protein